MRHIIIGDGATGTTAAYYIRAADKSASITIVSDDPNPAYYRAALTNYLLGELHESQLFAVPPDFYIENGIDRILARVASVDSKNNRVALADDRQIEYDQLLIASGSRPNAPTFPGAELSGVMTMRTLQDVRTVLDSIRSGRVKRAVVVGGGPLGIEWVQGLMHYKVQVTYLLRGDMFFDRALDRTASDLVISRLRAEGVDVRTNEEIDKAIGGRDGRLRAVHLKNSNQTIDCQLAGTAIGIRPNIEFLEGSGIEVARDEKRGTVLGVTVDKHMRSNISNVYAGGDVIHRTLGLWEPARLQGRIAGKNMAGGSETTTIGEHYFATRLYDLDFAGVGTINDKPGDEVLVDFPRGSGQITYRKLILRDNKLVGALMLGQRKENVRKYGLFYKKLIEDKVDMSPVADRLLENSFDLPNWIESLSLASQIQAARSIVATASNLPSPANVMKTEMAEASNTFAVQPLRAPKALLQLEGQVFTLEKTVTFGRKSDNLIVLNEPLVSSKHAHVEKRGVAYVVTDDNSTNGTFVNEKLISGQQVLNDGDVIKIGKTNINFILQAEENAFKTSAMPEEIPLEKAAPVAVNGQIEFNGKRTEIKEETITFGRDPEASIRIDDPTVSFMHAQISFHGSQHYLRDLGSRNGTFVNEDQVVTPCLLKNGDVIRLGSVKITFTTTATTPPVQPASSKAIKTDFIKKENKGPALGQLVIYTGGTIGLSFALKPPTFTVGREFEANAIALQSQTVSRKHARFDWHHDTWHVTDLQSGNGTKVNGKSLEPNVETPLAAKDEVQFGDVKLLYIPPSSMEQPKPNLPMTFIIEPEEEKEPIKPVASQPEPEPVSPQSVNPEISELDLQDAELTPPIKKMEPEVIEKKPAQAVEKQEQPPVQTPPVQQPAVPGAAGGGATQFIQSSIPTRLTVLAGPGIGRTIMLVNLPIKLGRLTTTDVQGLDDPLVSRQHMIITLAADGNIHVSDLGSVNGTLLNGIAMEPNQVFILNKGDELRMGSTVLKAG